MKKTESIVVCVFLAIAAFGIISNKSEQIKQEREELIQQAYEDGYDKGYEEGALYGFAVGQAELSGEIYNDLENLSEVMPIVDEYREGIISFQEMLEFANQSEINLFALMEYYRTLPSEIYDALEIKPYVFHPGDAERILGIK